MLSLQLFYIYSFFPFRFDGQRQLAVCQIAFKTPACSMRRWSSQRSWGTRVGATTARLRTASVLQPSSPSGWMSTVSVLPSIDTQRCHGDKLCCLFFLVHWALLKLGTTIYCAKQHLNKTIKSCIHDVLPPINPKALTHMSERPSLRFDHFSSHWYSD